MDERLKKFITTKLGVEDNEVVSEARLEEDLGMYGDDAMEFIAKFSKEFNVEVSDFKAADYFSPEGDIFLPMLVRALTGKKKKKHKELLVHHLEKAIIAGRLDEDVINS